VREVGTNNAGGEFYLPGKIGKDDRKIGVTPNVGVSYAEDKDLIQRL
jgi:hypothetical protein